MVTTARGSTHEGTPAVMAHYSDLEHARDAMRSLEASGIDGDDLALLGPAATELEQTTERRATDRRVLSSATAAMALGVVGGAVAGVAIGAVFMAVGALAFGDVVDRGWIVVLMIGWFAAGGAVLGAIASIARTVGFSESLPLTWEDEPHHPVWLAVYGDASEKDTVVHRVEATGPLELVDDPPATNAA